MQDHSTIIDRSPSTFTAKEVHVRRNIAFVSELDAKMKNDINAARRKLTNSVNTNNIREINFRVSGRPPQLLNPQNQLNSGTRLLRADRSQPHLISQPGVAYYYQSTTAQMPEENDTATIQLRKELIETRRELEVIRQNYHQADSEALMRANRTIAMLQQTINQNDVNSRQVISNIHRENEQLKIQIHNVRIQLQSGEKQVSQIQEQRCKRCFEFEQRIRYLEGQLQSVNSRYEKERSKLNLFQQQEQTFKNELQTRISTLAEKLNASQIELQKITSQKFQLERKIVQINSRDLSSFNEEAEVIKQNYNLLSQQYGNLTSQYEQLSTHHSQTINQLHYLQRKLYELHFQLHPNYKQTDQQDIAEIIAELQNKVGQINLRLKERTRENQELDVKLNEKESSIKKLSEEYSQLLERTEKYQERIEQLQRELSVSIDKEDNKIQEIQHDLMEELKKQRYQTVQLKRLIQERDEALTEVRHHLSEAQNYINQTVAAQFQQQSKTIQTLTSQNSELQSRLQRPNSQLQFYQAEINRLEDQLKSQSNQSTFNEQISTLQQMLEQERRQRSQLQKEYNQLVLILERKQQELTFVCQKLNALGSNHADSYEVNELKAILERRQSEFNQEIRSIKEKYQQRIINITNDLRDQVRALENENQNMIHQIEEVPRLNLQLSKCNQSIKYLQSQHQKALMSVDRKSQQVHQLEVKIEALHSREVRDGYNIYQSGSKITDSQSSNIISKKQPSSLSQDYRQVAHLEANIAELKSEINRIKLQEQAKIEEATSKLLYQNQTLQRKITSLQQNQTKQAHLSFDYTTTISQLQALQAKIKQLTQQNQSLSSQLSIASNNIQQTQTNYQQAAHKLHQQERYYGQIVNNLQISLKQAKDKSQLAINKLKNEHQQHLFDLNAGHQQQIINLKTQLQNQYKAELLQYRQASEQTILDRKEQVIKTLEREIEVLKTQNKGKGNEKYGELVIKHNTLNIDYQNLIGKSKQREEAFAKDKMQLIQAIEVLRRQSDLKINELIDANNKLAQESQTHYRHLEHAEAYIAEILDKLATLEAKQSKPETTDHQVYRQEIAQLQRELQQKVDEERKANDFIASLKLSTETLTKELQASQKESAHFRQLSDNYLSDQKHAEAYITEILDKLAALEAKESKPEATDHQIYQQKIVQLQRSIDQKADQERKANDLIASLKLSTETLTKELQASQKESAHFRQLSDTYLSNQKILEADKTKLNQAVRQLQTQIDLRSEQIRQLTSIQTSNNKFEITQLISKVKTLQSQNLQSNNQIVDLRKQIAERVAQIKRLSNQTQSNNLLKQSQEEIANLLNRLRQLEADKYNSDLELTRLRSEVNRNSIEIERLHNEVNRLSINRSDIRESQEYLEDSALLLVRNEVKEREQRMKEIQTQNQRIQELNIQMQRQLQLRMVELMNAQRTIEEMRGKLHLDSSSRRSDSSEYRQAYSRIEKELQESRHLLNGASEHIVRLQQVISRAEEQIRGLNGYIIQLQRKSEASSQKSSSPVKAFEAEVAEERWKQQILKLQSQNLRLSSVVKQLSSQIERVNSNSVTMQQKQLNKLIEQNQTKLNHINELTAKLLALQRENISQNQKVDEVVSTLTNVSNEKDKRLRQIQSVLKDAQDKAIYFQNKLKEAQNYIFQIQAERQHQSTKIFHLTQQGRKLQEANALQLKQIEGLTQKLTSTTHQTPTTVTDTQQLKQRVFELSRFKQGAEKDLLCFKSKVEELNSTIIQIQAENQRSRQIISTFQPERQQKQELSLKNTTLLQNIQSLKKFNTQSLQQSQKIILELQTNLGNAREDLNKIQAQKEAIQLQFKQLLEQKVREVQRKESERVEAVANHQKTLTAQLQKLQEKQKELEFFRNKLIEAEDYIVYLEKKKNQMEGNSERNQLNQTEPSTFDAKILVEENQQLKSLIQKYEHRIQHFTKNYIPSQELSAAVSRQEQKVKSIQRRLSQELSLLESKEQKIKELLAIISSLEDQIKRGKPISIVSPTLEQRIKELEVNLQVSERELSEANSKLTQLFIKITSLENEKITLAESNKQFEFIKSKLIEAQQYIFYLEDLRKKEVQQPLDNTFVVQLEQKIKLLESEQQQVQLRLSQAERYNRKANEELEFVAKEKNVIEVKLVQANQALGKAVAQLQNLHTEFTSADIQLLQKEKDSAKNQYQIIAIQVESLNAECLSLKADNIKLSQQLQNEKQSHTDVANKVKDLSQKVAQISNKLAKSESRAQTLSSANKLLEIGLEEYKTQLQKSTEETQFFKAKLSEAEAYIYELEQIKPIQSFEIHVPQSSGDNSELQTTIEQLEGIIKDLTDQKESIVKELQIARVNYQKIEDILKETEGKLVAQEQRVIKLTQQKQAIQTRVTQSEGVLLSNIETIQVLQDKLHQAEQQLIESARKHNEVVIDLTRQIESLRDKLTHQLKLLDAAEVQHKQSRVDKTERKDLIVEPSGEVYDEQFFKNKLLIAEEYIETLQQQKIQIQASRQQYYNKSNRQEEDLRKIIKELNSFKEVAQVQEIKISQLKRDNLELQEHLRVAASQASNDQIFRLTSQINQLKKDLQLQEQSAQQRVHSLESRNDQLSFLYQEQKTKYEKAQENVKSLVQTVAQIQKQTEYYRKKYEQSQHIISTLEAVKSADKETLKNLSTVAQLQQQIDSLIEDKKVLGPELTSARQEINDLTNKNSYFRQKLLEAEGYIVELEKERRKSQDQFSNDSHMDILRDKIVQLEERKREVQMKLILAEEKQKSYVENIRSLEDKMLSANASFAQAENKFVAEMPKDNYQQPLTRDLEKQLSKLGKDPQREKQFFKNKLLAAEAYITDLLRQKNQLELRPQHQESKFEQLSREIDHLNEEAVFNQATIQNLNQKNVLLTDKIRQLQRLSEEREKEIESFRQDARQFTIMLQEKQIRYDQHINMLTQELQEKIRIIQQLENQRDDAEQEAEAAEEKATELIERENASNKSSEESLENIDFFKGKLFEAEAFIKDLEDENEASRRAIADLNTKIMRLDEEISNLKDRNSVNNSLNSEPANEEQKMAQILAEVQSQISELRDENERLHQQLATITVEVKQTTQAEEEQPQDVTYLKKKLYEAESYIVQLQIENTALAQEATDRENAVKAMEANINLLTEQSVEAELANKKLQLQADEIKRQNSQLKEEVANFSQMKKILQEKVTQLQNSLAKGSQERSLQIQTLRAKLITQTSGQKETLQSQYKAVIQKKEEEINNLSSNLKKALQDLDSLKAKYLQVQEESERNIGRVKFFQGKLLEAEGYIAELQKENEDLNVNCEELKQNVLALEVNINGLADKINQTDTQKLVVSAEINTLKQDNQHLLQTIEQFKAKEIELGSKESDIVAQLKLKIKSLQEELNQQHLKSQVELDLLSNTLTQKEEQIRIILEKLQKSTYANSQLRKFYSIQEDTNQNIEKYVKFKQEGCVDLQSSVAEELEAAHNQITRLQDENIKHHNFTEELLEQIKRISEQNNRLTQNLYKLSARNIEDEEEGQQNNIDNNQIFQERTIKKVDRKSEQQEVIDNLIGQLASLKTEIQQKNRIIQTENAATIHIQQEITAIQTENDRLKERTEYLEEVQRQFEEFKSVVKQREEAQRQLQEVEKEIQQPQIKKQASHEVSSEQHSRESPSKNRRLEESLEEASKELEDQMKEETHQQAKELMKEISNLKVILQQTEDQNTVLKLQKANQMKVILQIGQTNGNLQQALQAHKNKQQELQEAIVLAQTQNLTLTSQIEQLRIKLHESQNQLNGRESRLTMQQAQKQSKIEELQADVEKLKETITQLQSKILSLQAQAQQSQRKLLIQQQQQQFPHVISPKKPQEGEQLIQQTNAMSSQEIKRLNAQLEEEREHLVMAECEIQELKTRLSQYQLESKQKSDRIQELEFEAQRTEEQLVKRQEIFEEDITQAEKRISSKSIELQTKEEKLSSSIRRLLTISQNHQEENADPTEILEELEDFPYLNELITSILYRLRLSSAIELEKGLKIESQKETIEQLASKNNELQEELVRARTSYNLLKQQNDILKNTNQKMEAELLKKFEERREQAELSQCPNELLDLEQKGQDVVVNEGQELIDERYNQLLKELVEYEVHNTELQVRLAEITQSHEKLKTQITNYEDQIKVLTASTNLKDLSQENLELRKKLQESQSRRDNSSIGTHSLLRLEFLQVCLQRIDQIERQVRLTQEDFERLASRERRMGLSSNQGKIVGEDSQLIERLQQLEERLMKNATNIINHQQNTDGELYSLLKELLGDEQISDDSKKKIEDYLQQLEQQILRQHEQHQAQLTILRQQIARKQLQQRPYSDRSREDLLREINNLNSAIQIYHQQSMRRKKLYKSTLEELVRDVYALYQMRQDKQTADIVRKIQGALEREQDEDLQFDGDDFIIAGGSGHVQVLEGRQREKQPEGLHRLQESVGELGLGEKSQPIAIQTEADAKPFLKYLLSVQDMDKQDLKLLKKKIAELRGRQVQENLQILKGKEKRLQQVLQMSNRQTSPQQIENIMVTLANNYSRDEISQIFGSEDADELINKLNQALCLEESFYKVQNSSALMYEIQERKKKYYESPTKLSEEVYKHLLLLLSAKKDEEFYEHVQSLFRSMYEVEDGFETALKKKDQIYRSHNQRMNQIFNRSSSDNSEDYLAEFERSNEQQIRIQSERKAKRSEENSEEEQELRRH